MFTKSTTLSQILADKNTKKTLEKFKIPCLSCPMAQFEIERLKIGDVCKMYGIDQTKLLKELNAKNK